LTFLEIDPFTLVGTALCIFGLLVEHFHFQGKLQERIAVLETACLDLATLKTDVTEIKTKMDLFWGALEAQIPSMLLKGNPIAQESKLYELLSKFHARRISDTEKCELIAEMDKEAKNGTHAPGETLALVVFTAALKAKMSEGGSTYESTCHT
jgi:hypothetical protein